MNRNLGVGFFCHRKCTINRCWCCSPVFVQFKTNRSRCNLLTQTFRLTGIALTQKTKVHRKFVSSLKHTCHIPGARRYRCCVGACCRACATAQHGSDTGCQCFFDLLWANKVNMRVDTTRRDDLTLGGNNVGTRANFNGDIRLNIRVTGLANGGDTSALNADIGFIDSGVVDNQSIRHDTIHDFF